MKSKWDTAQMTESITQHQPGYHLSVYHTCTQHVHFLLVPLMLGYLRIGMLHLIPLHIIQAAHNVKEQSLQQPTAKMNPRAHSHTRSAASSEPSSRGQNGRFRTAACWSQCCAAHWAALPICQWLHTCPCLEIDPPALASGSPAMCSGEPSQQIAHTLVCCKSCTQYSQVAQSSMNKLQQDQHVADDLGTSQKGLCIQVMPGFMHAVSKQDMQGTWSMWPRIRLSRMRDTSSCSTSFSGMLRCLEMKGILIRV